MRPSIVPPQATFPQICGALSDFSTPRNHKILKLCSRKDSVNLTVAWCEPEPHHAPCAPRAVWAQTGLVRGSFRPRTKFISHPRERSDPFTLSSGRGGTALAVGEVLLQNLHRNSVDSIYKNKCLISPTDRCSIKFSINTSSVSRCEPPCLAVARSRLGSDTTRGVIHYLVAASLPSGEG